MQPRDARAEILVTGATGTVGAEVVQRLAAGGQLVRAAVRDPEAAAWPEGVRPTRFDFMEARTFPGALRGVERLFLMRPPAIAWAERNPLVPHRRVEKRLVASPLLDATFLRPAFFMQNLLAPQGTDIRERIDLSCTRAIIDAIHSGALAGAPTERDARFGFAVPTRCPEVPAEILVPKNTWDDPAAYDEAAEQLARRFAENFEKYAGEADEALAEAGPRAQPA